MKLNEFIEEQDPNEIEKLLEPYKDEQVRFISSYKNILTYRNDTIDIQVEDYRYEFQQTEYIGNFI